MIRKIAGRALAAALGVVLGFAAATLRMPVETAGGSVLADRIAYSAGRIPQRGDLVVVENTVFTESGDGMRLMLRVVGLPGDRVQIRSGRLLINGEDMTDALSAKQALAEDMETVIVKEESLFLLSTQGSDHLDSRSEAVGQVAFGDVWGRVCFMFERERKENRHGTAEAAGQQ